MRRYLAAAGLLLLLTGCSRRLPDIPLLYPTEAETETGEAAPETAARAFQPDTAQPVTIPTEAETAPQPLYLLTLTDLHDEQLLPSGAELNLEGDIEQNRFAVYDIDGDGREELLLEITQAPVEERFTAVYDTDADGGLRRELRYEAEVTFWTRGIVTASYPDAAEHEGGFIPYAAAQYDPEQDTYTEFAYVSAIDRDILAAHDLLDEYPESADKSHTGRVYCIRGDNPVDLTDYEAWYASWHNNIHELEVPFLELTEENIKKLEE